MNSEALIRKAALVLDLKGDTERAIGLLEQAVECAKSERAPVALAEAHCFLGELLEDTGHSERAKKNLQATLDVPLPESASEVAAGTRQRARELLASLQG